MTFKTQTELQSKSPQSDILLNAKIIELFDVSHMLEIIC